MSQSTSPPVPQPSPPSGPPLPSDLAGTPPGEIEAFRFSSPRVILSGVGAGRTEVDTLEGDRGAALFFATWCTLLFRYSEQELFAVEVVSRQGSEWMAHVVEVRMDGGQTASQVIAHATKGLADLDHSYLASSRARQSVGFTCLAREAGPGTETLNSPPDLPLCRDLHLECRLGKTDYQYCLRHSGRFSKATIEQISRQYVALFTSLSHLSETAVRILPMLNQEDRRELLQRWSGLELPHPPPLVFQEIERRAAETPGAPAISLNSESLTYSELNRHANQLAHWLRSQGLEAGARVAVCMEPCLEFMACMLGILKVGATHVPLDPGYPPERLSVIVEDTHPFVVLTQRALAPKVGALLERSFSVEDLWTELPRFSGENIGYEVARDQTAYIVYTSGTTGAPKGVQISQASLAHYIAVARGAYGYGSKDVIPAIARFSFSITFFELLCPLASGARLVLLERNHVLDMQRMMRTLQEATCIHASPSLWRKLIAYADEQMLSASTFANLRHVSSGGDMVPPDVLESLKRIFVNAEVFVIYGCSEISCMGCTYPVPRDRKLTSTRVGRPFPNMTLRLLDPEGKLVPPGIVGEVCFGGAGLASAYLNAPELTARKFSLFGSERLYHTGDLGRVDSEGELELVGRSDFQIKLRGIRIEPAEVEAYLRSTPGVRDAIVAAPTLADGEKRLVAYVVPNPAARPTARAIREFLKGKLPDYMIPAAFVFLDALPVNVNQKVDRLALAQPSAVQLSPIVDSIPPRTERERKLVQIWENVLDVKGIGIRDEFFDIGGDSLRSVVLMAAIDKELGVALPVSTLLTEPTIERLAVLLNADSRRQTAASSLVCLRRGDGTRPSVFFVHDGDGESMPYRNMALRLHPGHSVYGIHPKASGHHPILHTRLGEMVDYYVEQIRSVQPKGPYFVGGLCIGGFIAFEVGRKLKSQGEVVGPIALIDVAHVKTPHRSIGARRFNRLSALFKGENAGGSFSGRANAIFKVAVRRLQNIAVYEARTRYERNRMKVKLRLLRYCLDYGTPIPAFLRNISVDAALRFAEREYVVPEAYQGEVLLFRATARDAALDGLIDDTPYIEIFEDPMLGWADKAVIVTTYDIPAGHSSMLREPTVREVATNLQKHIDLTLKVVRN